MLALDPAVVGIFVYLLVFGFFLAFAHFVNIPEHKTAARIPLARFSVPSRNLLESYVDGRVYRLKEDKRGIYAFCIGLGKRTRIYFNPRVIDNPTAYPAKFLDCLVAHECGHAAHDHVFMKILMVSLANGVGAWLLFFLLPTPQYLPWVVVYIIVALWLLRTHRLYCEFEADDFACHLGHREALVEYLKFQQGWTNKQRFYYLVRRMDH